MSDPSQPRCACHWTPVEHRLPDDEETVLAYAAGDDEPVWLAYVDTDEDGPRWRTVEGAHATPEGEAGWGPVTHWMSLPEGPVR